MAFAIKDEVCDPRAKTFAFSAQKTMYGRRHIARGDTVFLADWQRLDHRFRERPGDGMLRTFPQARLPTHEQNQRSARYPSVSVARNATMSSISAAMSAALPAGRSPKGGSLLMLPWYSGGRSSYLRILPPASRGYHLPGLASRST
jgi:hypothetical protein